MTEIPSDSNISAEEMKAMTEKFGAFVKKLAEDPEATFDLFERLAADVSEIEARAGALTGGLLHIAKETKVINEAGISMIDDQLVKLNFAIADMEIRLAELRSKA